jgi:hypothetical protein
MPQAHFPLRIRLIARLILFLGFSSASRPGSSHHDLFVEISDSEISNSGGISLQRRTLLATPLAQLTPSNIEKIGRPFAIRSQAAQHSSTFASNLFSAFLSGVHGMHTIQGIVVRCSGY